MRISRFMCAAVAAIVLAFGQQHAHAAKPETKATAEAEAFVSDVGTKALNTLKNEELSDSKKREVLNGLFAQTVDVSYVAKFVLGRYWRTATPKQQTDYMAAYQPFLIKNYVGRISKYSGQTFEITGSKPTPEGGAVVAMTLKTPDGSAPNVIVNYRLNKVGTGYKVIDILVEGVSLLNTQRSEFSSVVSNKGLDYLIDALKKKAAQAN